MGAPSQPKPLFVGGGVRPQWKLQKGFTESAETPQACKRVEVRTCVDADGLTRKAYRFAVKAQAVESLQKQFQLLAEEIRASALEVETKRLRLVFQLRKRKQGFNK
jgi:hypothetical protein